MHNFHEENILKVFLLTMLSINLAVAGISFAPKNFEVKGSQAVFVDFITMESVVTYDLKEKETTAESTIHFKVIKKGKPLFDLKEKVIRATLTGSPVKIVEVDSPDRETSYMMVDQTLEPGDYTLTLTNLIEANQRYDWYGKSVRAAFWMSDLTDRKYLEQYLPTNLEFDQFALTMHVKMVGNAKMDLHEVYTNGQLTVNGKNDFTIEFPEYFTASSFYYHLSVQNSFEKTSFNFKSINGKQVPVVVYSSSTSNVRSATTKTKKVLAELEGKLGAWPHPSLVVYVAGSGGMEHSGATRTSLYALGHELIHSYYARGVMPMDGNSGWMDEAIASWRDDGYQVAQRPSFGSSTMSGHSPYRRTTDRKAYSQGANFMAYLNYQLSEQGGLIAFLKHFHDLNSHKSVTTKMFKQELESYSGMSFTREFDRYIYGQKKEQSTDKAGVKENPYHVELSEKELENLL